MKCTHDMNIKVAAFTVNEKSSNMNRFYRVSGTCGKTQAITFLWKRSKTGSINRTTGWFITEYMVCSFYNEVKRENYWLENEFRKASSSSKLNIFTLCFPLVICTNACMYTQCEIQLMAQFRITFISMRIPNNCSE